MTRIFRDFRYIAWLFALIFVVSAILPLEDLANVNNFDKILHFSGFFFLMIFFMKGYRKNWLQMLILTLSIGLLVEVVQVLIPYRTFSPEDFLADAVGAILGFLSFRFTGDLAIDFIGTFGFIGKIPVGPGTLASLIFVFLIYYFKFSENFLLLFLITSTVVGIWVSSYLEEKWGDDPSSVVIDEVAGVTAAVVFHSVTLPVLFTGFLLFRFFDIVKPWPIKHLEKLPSGVGIMADDVVAGILANILLTFLSSGLINIGGV